MTLIHCLLNFSKEQAIFLFLKLLIINKSTVNINSSSIIILAAESQLDLRSI